MFRIRITAIVFGAVALYLIPAVAQQEEKLTITTYYPSPYGIYQNLRMNPSTNPGDCSGASAPLGKMYFDSTLNALFVCSRVGATYGYQLVPGGSGAWGTNSNYLYVMNTTLNVGIGTTAPLGKTEILYPLNSKGIYFTSPGYDTDSLNAAITFHSQTNSGQQGDVVIYHSGAAATPGLEIWGYPSDSNPSCCIFNTHFGINGNVGIGTRTPADKLSVVGNVGISQWLKAGGYTSGAGNVSAYSMEIGGTTPSATNGQATMFLHDWGVIAHQLRYRNGVLYLEAAGNGYGTSTTPVLDVGGDIYMKRLSPQYTTWSGVGAGGAAIVNSNEASYRALMIVGSNQGTGNGRVVKVWDYLSVQGNAQVTGSLTKGSGSFEIPHPDPAKEKEGYVLRHSFVESPTRGDNLYRFTVSIDKKGRKDIELPDYFKYLNEDPQVWVSPADNFGRGYGTVDPDLTKASITVDTAGTFNVLIIGTRKDKIAKDFFDKTGIEFKKDIKPVVLDNPEDK